MTCCWTSTRMACCSCWLVVLLLVLVVTGLVLPLLLGQGGHVLISSYAKRNPSLRIVGENCYTLLYCCLYFCFVLFLLLSLAYSRRCYHVVWLCCFFPVVVVVHVVAFAVGRVPSSSSSSLLFVVRCCCRIPLLVAITVYCCFALFRVVLRCFALFRIVSHCCCCCFVLLLFLSMRLLCSLCPNYWCRPKCQLLLCFLE